MPFKSQAQRAYLYAKHPDIARRWEKETPKGKKLPRHAKSTMKKVAKRAARGKAKYDSKKIRKMIT